jgi:hypothetical protein
MAVTAAQSHMTHLQHSRHQSSQVTAKLVAAKQDLVALTKILTGKQAQLDKANDVRNITLQLVARSLLFKIHKFWYLLLYKYDFFFFLNSKLCWCMVLPWSRITTRCKTN